MSIPNQLKKNLSIPVIGAPMFIISTPKLVIAQCKAGIVGCFPSVNARPQSQLKEWIQEIKAALEQEKKESPEKKIAPFGINIVAIDSNQRLEQDVQTCIDEKVPIIITSMRAPNDIVKRVHEYGGLHFHDVINRRHAEKAIEAGVDGLILVCAGAGGHAGQLNPFAFIKEIRSFFDGTLILSGSITSGEEVLATQILGADLSYIGTRFIATEEANAVSEYKQMLIDSKANDIVLTPHFTGVNASFLKPSIKNTGLNPEKIQGPLIRKPNKLLLWWKHRMLKNSKKWKTIWSAGQGVANIHDIVSVNTYVSRLIEEYNYAKKKLPSST